MFVIIKYTYVVYVIKLIIYIFFPHHCGLWNIKDKLLISKQIQVWVIDSSLHEVDPFWFPFSLLIKEEYHLQYIFITFCPLNISFSSQTKFFPYLSQCISFILVVFSSLLISHFAQHEYNMHPYKYCLNYTYLLTQVLHIFTSLLNSDC